MCGEMAAKMEKEVWFPPPAPPPVLVRNGDATKGEVESSGMTQLHVVVVFKWQP